METKGWAVALKDDLKPEAESLDGLLGASLLKRPTEVDWAELANGALELVLESLADEIGAARSQAR
jgi:hypothetical protein